MNMKHAVKDIRFRIISEHINISKLRFGPKLPLFSMAAVRHLLFLVGTDDHFSATCLVIFSSGRYGCSSLFRHVLLTSLSMSNCLFAPTIYICMYVVEHFRYGCLQKTMPTFIVSCCPVPAPVSLSALLQTNRT